MSGFCSKSCEIQEDSQFGKNSRDKNKTVYVHISTIGCLRLFHGLHLGYILITTANYLMQQRQRVLSTFSFILLKNNTQYQFTSVTNYIKSWTGDFRGLLPATK